MGHEFTDMVVRGVPEDEIVEQRIRLCGDRGKEDLLHIKVMMIEGQQYLVLVDAEGPTIGGHLGYKTRTETCFRVRFELVQTWLRFESVDLSRATRGEREKFVRLMNVLLDVMDCERRQAVFGEGETEELKQFLGLSHHSGCSEQGGRRDGARKSTKRRLPAQFGGALLRKDGGVGDGEPVEVQESQAVA